jgi:hypothetical protein
LLAPLVDQNKRGINEKTNLGQQAGTYEVDSSPGSTEDLAKDADRKVLVNQKTPFVHTAPHL